MLHKLKSILSIIKISKYLKKISGMELVTQNWFM